MTGQCAHTEARVLAVTPREQWFELDHPDIPPATISGHLLEDYAADTYLGTCNDCGAVVVTVRTHTPCDWSPMTGAWSTPWTPILSDGSSEQVELS